jgi:membrane associated rhomboid family serine protease
MSATDGLLGAACGSYILQLVKPNIVGAFSKSNYGLGRGQYYRLMTALFLHGSPLHLMFNGVALSNIGPEVERWFGRERFVGVFVGAGLCSTLASWRFVSANSIGMSGAVFGLLGAWSVFLVENQALLGKDAATDGLTALAKTVGINLLLGLATPNIDHSGHLGGLVGGVACGFLLAPRLRAVVRPWTVDRVLVDYARLPTWAREANHAARERLSAQWGPRRRRPNR